MLQHPPQKVNRPCLYLALKTESFALNIQSDEFQGDAGKYQTDIERLAYCLGDEKLLQGSGYEQRERLLLETMEFDLHCYHPFRPLESAHARQNEAPIQKFHREWFLCQT